MPSWLLSYCCRLSLSTLLIIPVVGMIRSTLLHPLTGAPSSNLHRSTELHHCAFFSLMPLFAWLFFSLHPLLGCCDPLLRAQCRRPLLRSFGRLNRCLVVPEHPCSFFVFFCSQPHRSICLTPLVPPASSGIDSFCSSIDSGSSWPTVDLCL
jgi:hypothetical protein